jgi:hypothetical protein
MQPCKTAGVTVTASGQLLAAFPGKRIRVHGIALISAAATTATLRSASTDVTGSFPLAANGGFVIPFSDAGWFETAVGEALNINLSVSTATGVQLIFSTI